MVSVTMVCASSAEADERIDHYMEAYHPAGYGTFVRSRTTNPDGTVTVVILRGSSCD